MTSIIRATEKDYITIINIGKESVTEAHKDSCDSEILNEFMMTQLRKSSLSKTIFIILLITTINQSGFRK